MTEAQAPSRAWVILRWIGVLPAAIVGGVVAGMLSNVINQLSLSWAGFNPEWWVSQIYTDAVANATLGAACIYAGARTAPSHKTTVALALSGLLLVFAGMTLFPTLMDRNWRGVYGTVVLIVAAGAMAWSVHSGESKDADFS